MLNKNKYTDVPLSLLEERWRIFRETTFTNSALDLRHVLNGWLNNKFEGLVDIYVDSDGPITANVCLDDIVDYEEAIAFLNKVEEELNRLKEHLPRFSYALVPYVGHHYDITVGREHANGTAGKIIDLISDERHQWGG